MVQWNYQRNCNIREYPSGNCTQKLESECPAWVTVYSYLSPYWVFGRVLVYNFPGNLLTNENSFFQPVYFFLLSPYTSSLFLCFSKYARSRNEAFALYSLLIYLCFSNPPPSFESHCKFQIYKRKPGWKWGRKSLQTFQKIWGDNKFYGAKRPI